MESTSTTSSQVGAHSGAYQRNETTSQRPTVGTGRRPVHYNGSEGWESRIGSRTLYGAGFGAGAGLVTGAVRGGSIARWVGVLGTNFALATACFCGTQELVRELLAADPDDLGNSVLGGLVSGGLLGRIQGGPARALPCALLFAGVGTSSQFGANQWKRYRLKQFVEESWEGNSSESGGRGMEAGVQSEGWKLPEWFPIQVLDEKAAAERKAKQDAEFRDRVDRLQKGGG